MHAMCCPPPHSEVRWSGGTGGRPRGLFHEVFFFFFKRSVLMVKWAEAR